MRKTKLACAILAIIGFAGTVQAAPNKQYPPKDECLRVGEYFQFRQQFEDIVKRRNTAALTALIAPDVKWVVGEEDGASGDAKTAKAGFAAYWKLAKGAASPIWAELDAILPLGCGIHEKGIAFPFIFTVETGASDVFNEALVTYEDVNLRASPSSSAASKTKISWELVKVKDGIVKDGWTPVTTADGKTGFIKSNYLRSSAGYRAGFEKRDGKWVMHFLTSGD